MIDKYKEEFENRGVSPVIGVILLVAVTVALVALSTVIVFNIGSDVSDTADITLDVSEQDDSVDVTVVRNENVEELRVILPDSSTESFDASVGTTAQVQGEAGSYNVVAVLADGSEESVRSFTISEDSAVESTTGVISFNPPAEGVLVESYDENDNLVDSDSTGSDGVYSVQEADELRVMGSTVSENAMDEDGNIDLNVVADEESTSVQDILLNGEGTESSPYEINFASDLQVMNEDLDAHYELVSDIDASGTSEWNDNKGFEPIGDDVNEFTGSLDGQGYEVDGLTIDRPEEDNVGLFGYIDESHGVDNIGVVNTDITGDSYVGALVGTNMFSEISEIYTSGQVHGANNIGGVVGAGAGQFNNIYSYTDTSGDADEFTRVGGIAGNFNEGEIINSYAIGTVTGDDEVGGLVGSNGGTVTDSYWDTEASGVATDGSDGATGRTTEEMTGDDAEINMEGFDFTDTWVTVDSDYPELRVFE